MIRLFCIREDNGRPVAARLMGRAFVDSEKAEAEVQRLLGTRKWTKVAWVEAGIPLYLQAAQWAASLIRVNPRYVLEPSALWYYIKGPNWNDPEVACAHYETQIQAIGFELWQEFSGYRGVPLEEAVRRMAWLLRQIGIFVQEGRQ